MSSSDGDGKRPVDILESYGLPLGVRWYRWNGDEHVCDVCGLIFDDIQKLSVHRRYHFAYTISGVDQGTNFDDLVSGVSMMWNEFRSEHPLPVVVPLFGDVNVRGRTRGVIDRSGSYMPLYYEDRILDESTSVRYGAIVFPDMWMRLDIDGKCASLAHAAAHIENATTQHVHDVSFSGNGWHNRLFMRTACTYDLYVSNVPGRGYAMTIINDTFRERHADAMKRMGRFRPFSDIGGRRVGYCGL